MISVKKSYELYRIHIITLDFFKEIPGGSVNIPGQMTWFVYVVHENKSGKIKQPLLGTDLKRQF